MKNISIYSVQNKINKKIYIGQSVDPRIRWNSHKAVENKSHLANAIKKYGEENFEFKTLMTDLTRAEANYIEQRLITLTRSLAPKGYNVAAGGKAGDVRAGLSKERYDAWRQKLSDAKTGTKRSPETIEKIRKASASRRHSEESKQKMSRNKKGSKLKKMSPEALAEKNRKRKATIRRKRDARQLKLF